MLDIDAELANSGGKPTDADILAELRGEHFDEGETDDASEKEYEPPIFPTSLEVNKAVEVLQINSLCSAKAATKREKSLKRLMYMSKERFLIEGKVPSVISLPNSKILKTLLTLYFIALKDQRDLQKHFFILLYNARI